MISKWNSPADKSKIELICKENNWYFPDDYKQFLLLHNGAVLFTHPKYAGGTEILDLERMLRLHADCGLPEHWYPIAWTDVVIGSISVDSKKAKNNQYPYLFFLDAMNPIDEAVPIQCDFTTWLSRLIISQGEEYWLWDYFDKLTFTSN